MKKKWEVSEEDLKKMQKIRDEFSKIEKQGLYESLTLEEMQEIVNDMKIQFRTTT